MTRPIYATAPATNETTVTIDAVAIIPARGGSKRIPRKNVAMVAGLPLIAHTIRHAQAARLVRDVYVSTDDAQVADIARAYGAHVITRPPELATDDATSESALLNALQQLGAEGREEPEVVVFLQCTSPVRRPHDIDRAIETLASEGADSVFSACRVIQWLWREQNGQITSLNFDIAHRPRSQDFPAEFKENGSIFVFKPWVLREHQNRLGGRIALYEMDFWSGIEVDSPEELALCEWILTHIVAGADPAMRPGSPT
jgi:N-acylneuraminate cytidylyltransferase